MSFIVLTAGARRTRRITLDNAGTRYTRGRARKSESSYNKQKKQTFGLRSPFTGRVSLCLSRLTTEALDTKELFRRTAPCMCGLGKRLRCARRKWRSCDPPSPDADGAGDCAAGGVRSVAPSFRFLAFVRTRFASNVAALCTHSRPYR